MNLFFFKNGSSWVMGSTSKSFMPTGKYLLDNATETTIDILPVGRYDNTPIYQNIAVTTIKKNAEGDFYASLSEFLTAVEDFFADASALGGDVSTDTYKDDFILSPYNHGSLVAVYNSGTGSGVYPYNLNVPGAVGALEAHAGTNTNGFAGISSDKSFSFYDRAVDATVKMWLPDPLPTATDNYLQIMIGFVENRGVVWGGGDSAFLAVGWDAGTSTVGWKLISQIAAVAKESTWLSITAPVADAEYICRVVVNAAGTSAEFFVNGVSVGTISGANFPTNRPNMMLCSGIVKTAGVTDVVAFYDYVKLKI
jgi:hypothetical protein